MSKKGKIYVVGIGPGNKEHMSYAAVQAIEEVEVVVGYKTYMTLIEHMLEGKELYDSGMKREIDRCMKVLEFSDQGKSVAIVSSGESGVYGMAGIMLELADESYDIEIVPGITASNAAAACLGAPIMHDHATISLSDLMTDWELIKKRLHCAGDGDFVVNLYNPRSKGRQTQIVEARDILMKYKKPETVVGIVRSAKRAEQEVEITTLEKMLDCEINMFTMVIIGNSNTYVKHNKMVTPRGYKVQ